MENRIQPTLTQLPPITSIMKNFPTFELPIFNDLSEKENSCENSNCLAKKDECTRTPQYSLLDDLQILKTINAYYGTAFHGRVPWSFWQTFRKVTGNKRSSSSLYHHWNGAMKRKYGSFLSHGRLTECISWIETAIKNGKPIQKRANDDDEYTGMPMAHNWSLPPVPLSIKKNE